jgi:NADH-quinone oxidoreductase subunit N
LLAAFAVISAVMRATEAEDISALAGLHQRSPLLATAMTLAMVSLAGVPPLVGFFGKFLLIKSVVEAGAAYYWLIAVVIVGVVISMWYYFGVIRAIYWSQNPVDLSPIPTTRVFQVALAGCMIGMLYLGLFPNFAVKLAGEAVKVLK